MNYVISVLLIGVLVFVIVKNSIAIYKKVKDKKENTNKENAVEVGGVDNLDSVEKKDN